METTDLVLTLLIDSGSLPLDACAEFVTLAFRAKFGGEAGA
jgi:hypothetical protein